MKWLPSARKSYNIHPRMSLKFNHMFEPPLTLSIPLQIRRPLLKLHQQLTDT